MQTYVELKNIPIMSAPRVDFTSSCSAAIASAVADIFH